MKTVHIENCEEKSWEDLKRIHILTVILMDLRKVDFGGQIEAVSYVLKKQIEVVS
jgi:hypothetical protein